MSGAAAPEQSSPIARLPEEKRLPGAPRFGWMLASWPWLAAATSGGLLVLCFPTAGDGWLAWLALTPLIAAVWFSPPGGWWRNLALGYLTGLVYFTGSFSWLGALGELVGNPWLRLLPALLSLYLALFPAFWAWFIGLLRPAPAADQRGYSAATLNGYDFSRTGTNLGLALLGASAWVAQEWVRGWLFSGFGWNGLGVALYAKLPFIQIAEWTGVGGISFLLAFTNIIAVATLRRFVAEIVRGRVRPHWDFSVTITLICVTFAFGIRRLQERRDSTPLSVAAVQANIPQNQKWNQAFEDRIFSRYRELTDFAAQLQPDLIIWPEASLPGPVFLEPNHEFVREIARTGEFSLLLGSIDFDLKGDTQFDFNAAILVTGRGAHTQSYRKNHLVPFGEYVPFRNSFPLFALVVGDLVPADFRAGEEYTVLRMPNPAVNLGPLICFEDTIGDLARRFVLGGAEVLVNVTNDGWFMRSHAAEQHLANAVFRAVENRRPLIRAANTGVTCFIDERGAVTNALRGVDGTPFVTGVLTGRVAVPRSPAFTFYTRHGELFSHLCASLTLIAGIVLLRHRRRA
jgi:apolipoprotein N-acyltransferase